MKWISVKDKLPEEMQTVWICHAETKFIALACLTYYDGWLWVISDGTIYSKDNKIIIGLGLVDDCDITHWMTLPELPNIKKK